MGYKSGRISQLIGATRPSSSSGLKRPTAATEGVEDPAPIAVARPSSSSGLKRPSAATEEVENNMLPAAAPKRRVRGKQTVPAYDLPNPVEQPKEKAAPRQPYSGELCLGLAASACIFSTRAANEKAHVKQKTAGGQQCMFCSASFFQKAMSTPQGKGVVTGALGFFHENSEETFAAACERIKTFTDVNTLEQCLDRLSRLQKRGLTREARGRTAREKKKEREEAQHNNTWQHLRRKRRPQLRAKKEEVKQYKDSTQKNALRRLSRKFPGVYRPNGQATRPDVEWRTSLAAAFRQYALEYSWAMCASCHRMAPQKFHPKHARSNARGRALQRTIQGCKHCRQKVGYQVPQLQDVPEPLRKLPQTVLDALAIFRVYTGPHEQGYQAYRVHSGAIRFSWHERTVEDRLSDLTEKDWQRGRPAFEWLRDAQGPSYKDFLAAHHAFLEKRAAEVASGDIDLEEHIRWLPLRFMETVGLECAIWPHLYWDTKMTETFVRSQDARRQARHRAEHRWQEEGDEEDWYLQAEEAGEWPTDEQVGNAAAALTFSWISKKIHGFYFFVLEMAFDSLCVLCFQAFFFPSHRLTSRTGPRGRGAEHRTTECQGQLCGEALWPSGWLWHVLRAAAFRV